MNTRLHVRGRARHAACLLGLVAIAALAVVAPAPAQPSINWSTVDGGGAMRTTGGSYTLSGTIGQWDAGHELGGACVLGGGFWKGGGVAVGIDDPDEGAGTLPSFVFRLDEAAPNPVSARTRVGFSLRTPGAASLRIYDVGGRLARRLEEGTLPAGRQERLWDGRDDSGRRVPAGVYLLRLTAGAEQATRKLVVLR